jgi:hypothetical protein
MNKHQRLRGIALGLSLAFATVAVAPMAMADSMSNMSMGKTVEVGGAPMY